MPRSELVRVRAEDLEPGRRVLIPGAKYLGLVELISVALGDDGRLLLDTESSTYVCEPTDLIDAEDIEL